MYFDKAGTDLYGPKTISGWGAPVHLGADEDEGGGGGGGGSGSGEGLAVERTGNLGDCTSAGVGAEYASVRTLHTTGEACTIRGFPAPAAGDSKHYTLIVGTSSVTQIYHNDGVVAANGINLPTGPYIDLLSGMIIEFVYDTVLDRWVPESWNDLAAGALGANAPPGNAYQFRQLDGRLGASASFTQEGGYPCVGADRTGGAASSGELKMGALCSLNMRSANTYSGLRVDWQFLNHSTVFGGSRELLSFGSDTTGARYIHQIHSKAGEWNKMTAGIISSSVYPAGAYAVCEGAWLGALGRYFAVFPNFFVAGSNLTIEALGPDPLGGGKGYAFFSDVLVARTSAVNSSGFALSPHAATHHPMATIGDVDYNLMAGFRRVKVNLAGTSQDVSANKAVRNCRSIVIVSTSTLSGDVDLTLPYDSGTVTVDGLETSATYFFLVRFDYAASTHKVTLKNGASGTNVVTIGGDAAGHSDTGKRTAIVSSDIDGVWLHGWATDNVAAYKTVTTTGSS